MKKRFFATVLSCLMLFSMVSVPAYATESPAVMTFVQNIPDTDDSLYMGTNDSWPLLPKIQFEGGVGIGVVTYQWYRQVGSAAAQPFGNEETAISEGNSVYGTDPFYRSTLVAGPFTYYVVFTNTLGGASQTIESNHRTTWVTPQVLKVTDQNYDAAETYYYFKGSTANEFSVTLGLPDDTAEFAESSYGTIHYQWYKSTVETSDWCYDDFPFFDTSNTWAMANAGGIISYADAADADGVTLTYTPANDEVNQNNGEVQPYYYFVLVWDEWNGAISASYDVQNVIVQVQPSPVTSVTRETSGATIDLSVTMPTGRTVNSAFQYLLVPYKQAPAQDAQYSTGTLEGTTGTIEASGLTTGEYNLYLLFTDNESHVWSYIEAIPAYVPKSSSYNALPVSSGTTSPINAGTTDGAVKAEGTIQSTSSGSTVTITNASFQNLVTHSQSSGSGLEINTPQATATFDFNAVSHISELSGSSSVVLGIQTVNTSILPEAAKELVGNRPVYDFTLTVGGNVVSSFGEGSVSISIPYTLSDGEVPEAVVVYYLDDSDNVIPVTGVYNSQTQTVDFSITHFSSYAVGYNLVNFTDVTQGDWYYKAVTFLAARGITSGTEDSLFAPQASITRGQFIMMLLRTYGISPDADPTDNFADGGNTYYTNYLATAKRLGIASGIGDNQFAPDQTISRQDMFTLLYRALGVMGKLPEASGSADLSAYEDGASVADYAQEAITSLVSSGIVTGSNGFLMPDQSTTRAEAGMVFYNLLSE